MNSNKVLEVCNLPSSMNSTSITKFVSHLGAQLLYSKRKKKKRSLFLLCSTADKAKELLHLLHQLPVAGSLLAVRYCDVTRVPLKYLPDVPAASLIGQADNTATLKREQDCRISSEIDNCFTSTSSSFTFSSTSSSTAAHSYPAANRLLRYRYPPANTTILTNIANALVARPSFYTQVLHLMNKMNLPAPFKLQPTTLFSNIELPQDDPGCIPQCRSSTSESELSTDEERTVAPPSLHVDAEQRKQSMLPRLRRRPRKRRTPPTTAGDPPMTQRPNEQKRAKLSETHKPVTTSEVFEGISEKPVRGAIIVNQIKEINLRGAGGGGGVGGAGGDDGIGAGGVISGGGVGGGDEVGDGDRENKTSSEIKDNLQDSNEKETPSNKDAREEQVGSFGILLPLPKQIDKTSSSAKCSDEVEMDVEDDEDNIEIGGDEFITSGELRRGRMHADDLKSIAAFSRYERGDATMRLYVKNLAKQVTMKDLTYIYGRFVDWKCESDRLAFDVQVMQKGRMKGQAFVTFASERAACRARRETHTFQLHGKPMVVSFARSHKPK